MSSDAQRLADAFQGAGRVAALADPPDSVEAGYLLQDAVRDAIGRKVIGWKLAHTRPKVQATFGIDAPSVGPLLEGMIVPADTVFSDERFYAPEVEAEIALELRTDLPGPFDMETLVNALAGVRCAIEVADTRYEDKSAMGIGGLLGDLNGCGALVVGPLLDRDELSGLMDSAITMRIGNGTLLGPLEADLRPNPLEMLSFLARFLADRGETLKAGMIITTGTNTAPTRSGPGLVTAEFGRTSEVSARLGAPRG